MPDYTMTIEKDGRRLLSCEAQTVDGAEFPQEEGWAMRHFACELAQSVEERYPDSRAVFGECG